MRKDTGFAVVAIALVFTVAFCAWSSVVAGLSKCRNVGLAGTNAHGLVDVEQNFPSPICPVFAAAVMASMVLSTSSLGTATSILILGKKVTAYSAPR